MGAGRLGMDVGLISGPTAYAQALRQAIITACEQGCREMRWLDESFVDWPLSDPEVLAALTTWARRPRCLHLMAAQYDEVRLRHPLFVRWRLQFGHCVQARAFEVGASRAGLVAALLAVGAGSTLSVRLFDAKHCGASVSLLAADGFRIRERFDALAQRSSESFAATTLGL